MKKIILSILLVSTLSLSLFIGCSDKKSENNLSTPSFNQEESSDKNETTEDTSNNSSEEISMEEKVQAKFTEAMNYLYNMDYTNHDKLVEAEEYINKNFTLEGAKDMLNKVTAYNADVSSSDFLITLTKEIENNDERYASMYEIRYNITVAIGKPSIYSDILAVLVADRDGNVFIESINEFNF